MTGVRARAGLSRTSRNATCGMARRFLYGLESGAINPPTLLERHRKACLNCQAAAVRQRRLMRELASLRHQLEPLPHDMAAGLEPSWKVVLPEPERRAWAKPAGKAVASVAGAAAIGIFVLANRRMRLLSGGR